MQDNLHWVKQTKARIALPNDDVKSVINSLANSRNLQVITWRTEIWQILAYLSNCLALICFFFKNTNAWFWCSVTCWELVWKFFCRFTEDSSISTRCVGNLSTSYSLSFSSLYTIFCINLSFDKLLELNEVPLFIWKLWANKWNVGLKCSFHQEVE